MGFWAKLFGKGKSEDSAAAPEGGEPKPASESPPDQANADAAPTVEPEADDAAAPEPQESGAGAPEPEESGAEAPESDPGAPETANDDAPAPDPQDRGEATSDCLPEAEQPGAENPAPAIEPENRVETTAGLKPAATQPEGGGAPAILLAVGQTDEADADSEPVAAQPSPPQAAQRADGVEYLRTTFGVYPADPAFQATKKVYRAHSGNTAIAFLKTQSVSEPLFHIEVETPDGPFGLDNRNRVFNANGRFVDF